MKKFTCLVLTVIATVIVGCSRDNKDNVMTSNTLSQTIWEGSMTSYDSEDNPGVTTKLILEFLSETEGNCILPKLHDIQDFQYAVNKSVISFNGSLAVNGDWYIIELSKKRLVLQSYIPTKMVMTLNRTY